MKTWIVGVSGDSGCGKTTLSNAIKNVFDDTYVLECDRYHKWERHNENWKKYTHLNPFANDISKMHSDILNLKNGVDVLQHDYDHSTGKFTEPELIRPTSNLVVCGLHSLYESKLYDLKIFIDTDRILKTTWKIKRDVVERNYDLEKVITQIRIRESDFEKYIRPQRDAADLVIRFFSISSELLPVLSSNLVALRMCVSHSRDVSKIDSVLSELQIVFDKTSEETRHCYEFKDTACIENLNSILPTTRNDYYDFVILFIKLLSNK